MYLMGVTQLVAWTELVGEDLNLNPIEHIFGKTSAEISPISGSNDLSLWNTPSITGKSKILITMGF